jgi:hypothetical protein
VDHTCSKISGQPVAQGGREALIEGEYRIFFTPRALDDLDESIRRGEVDCNQPMHEYRLKESSVRH